MSVGMLTLHRFNGDEIFRVGSATILTWQQEAGLVCVNFEIDTEVPAVQTLPDTEVLQAHPGAEWTVVLDKFIPDEMVGKTYVIHDGLDEDTGDWCARFYYVEHEPISNSELTITARFDDQLSVQITGTITDVNYYDGSMPPTQIVIEARFCLPNVDDEG